MAKALVPQWDLSALIMKTHLELSYATSSGQETGAEASASLTILHSIYWKGTKATWEKIAAGRHHS